MSKHTGLKPHPCDFCPMSFAQRGNLRAHIQVQWNTVLIAFLFYTHIMNLLLKVCMFRNIYLIAFHLWLAYCKFLWEYKIWFSTCMKEVFTSVNNENESHTFNIKLIMIIDLCSVLIKNFFLMVFDLCSILYLYLTLVDSECTPWVGTVRMGPPTSVRSVAVYSRSWAVWTPTSVGPIRTVGWE